MPASSLTQCACVRTPQNLPLPRACRYELSLNLPKLNEFWTGELKDNKLKEGQEPPPNISKEQVRCAARGGGVRCEVRSSIPALA